VDFDGKPKKNERVSIHRKYKRRLRRLSRVLDEYLQLARIKLDPLRSGNIRNRTGIEQSLSKATELAVILTMQEELTNRPRLDDVLVRAPKQTAGDSEKISIGEDELFKELTTEEWEEMISAFKKRD
jgi:hypothetical protein